jgi:cbb3-type cytochrome oxidase subunit 3
MLSLHADIPRTGGKGSDLAFEAVLQEYLQFPYEYFLLVLFLFLGYCCKICSSYNPRRKIRKDQDRVNVLAEYRC